MATVPQRDLRNHISAVLRRAEAGERLTITVDGRPVAELGPVAANRALLSPTRLIEIIEDTPVDPGWRDDLDRMRAEDREAARADD